jgi:glycosyltransferase involved in cell wall biosynthesis
MKIAHVIPGNGGSFYCENCLRDSAIVRALRVLGHDAVAAPMYLPLPTGDFGAPGAGRVFYGAVALYLSQSVPLLKRMPDWLERLLDSPPALALASRMSGATSASGLSDLTLAMLEGSGDFLRRQLDGLVGWLKREVRPDIVHLSNALLLGLAGRIRSEVGVPVVVSLQDEDTWIDVLPKRAASQAWSLLARDAAHADLFLPVSRWYAAFLSERLGVEQALMRVIPVGIDTSRYIPALPQDPPRIGYLSRLSRRMGFGVLAEAFAVLKRMPGMERVRLAACGGRTGEDAGFLKTVFDGLSREGLMGDVEILRGFSMEERIRFLSGLSLLSVPAPTGEAFGTFLIEAFASGVPVVEPRAGAFPEIVEQSEGGILTDTASPADIARAMAELLGDGKRARRLGENGRRTAHSVYTTARMAKSMAEAFHQALSRRRTA